MNDKNRTHLRKHQTPLNQTLQKQLVRSLAFNVRDLHADMTRLANPAKEVRRAYADMTRLANPAKEVRRAYADMTRLANPAKEVRRAYADMTRLANPAEEVRRAYADMARLANPAEEVRRAYADMTRLANPAEEVRRAYADMARLANPAEDWEKQVSFLSATPASLGFPNIIRDGLGLDSFRSSLPGRHYAPSPGTPPATIIDKVYEEISPEIIPAPPPELVPITNREKVFIVHGHDHAARDTVSELVDNWNLIPTILDAQPNKGRTIIEKFEQCANEASFAIVLLTPDDVGAPAENRGDLKPRARQNVIFELGYFIKALGRQRICILYEEGVELPSDIQGVVYVPMDEAGEWRQRVIREMVVADLLVDMNKI